jgi:transglutaminase-like putative cysteine protease
MEGFWIRLLSRLRPREGWPAFLLTLSAVLCAPAALLQAAPDLGAGGMLLLTTLAVVVALRLVRSRLSARGAALVAAALGLGLTAVAVGRLLPPLSAVWADAVAAARWLGHRHQPWIPLSSSAGIVWQRLNELGVRLWWWARSLSSGAPAHDPIVFLLACTFLGWLLGLWATWQIYRRRAPLVGMLPSGIALATVAFFAGGMAIFYLFVLLFCTLWLVAICHLWQSEDRWEQSATDYPGDLGLELTLALAPGIVAVLLVAAFFPVIRPQQMSQAFWNVMEGPWSKVEQTAGRLFGPIGGRFHGGAGLATGEELPQAHLLGTGPELSEQTVMYVRTTDPPPPKPAPEDLAAAASGIPRRYWRSMTYDTYTGRGWINGPLEARTVAGGQSLDPNPPPGPELVQEFELVTPPGAALYVANAPLRLDRPVQAWEHAPGDLSYLTGASQEYIAVSRPPKPTILQLRNAPATVPPEIAERYLALPDSVPQRVLDLASQVVGTASTRYEQARAIELFLRTYTYTLEVPLPPADRDVVDYFLFDLQEGYCDYYASAMVVMGRAVGIPARLATGYAQGHYNYDRQRWVVAGSDGHSWPEVYFQGIGWIEFEPTAGQPALRRPGGDASAPVIPAKPTRPRPGPGVLWGLVIVGGVLVLLLALLGWMWRSREGTEMAATDLVRDCQARLLHWGARLGLPFRDGQTTHEYAAGLATALRARGQGSRWLRVRQASTEAPPAIAHLADTFARAQYGAEPIGEREGEQIRSLWFRLRRHLGWLWLSRR